MCLKVILLDVAFNVLFITYIKMMQELPCKMTMKMYTYLLFLFVFLDIA